MNHHLTSLAVASLLTVAVPRAAHAVTADLGSDGSDGALNVTTDTTLPLPADGVFHFTTVTVAQGATLKFSYAGPLHPGVALLATGDVVINGTIDLRGGDGAQGAAGKAGAGGSPGAPASFGWGREAVNVTSLETSTYEGPGLRPSGGTGGRSAHRSDATGCTSAGAGGGGGGGAIVVLSNTSISGSGTIDTGGGGTTAAVPTGPSGCSGNNSPATRGWDGAVRLGAPRVDLAGATVVARIASFDAVVQQGLPTVSRTVVTQTVGSTRTGTLLQRFPSTLPVATITAVNGVTVAPGSTAVLAPGVASGPFPVRVHVEGCVAGQAQVGVLTWEDASGSSSVLGLTTATNLTGSDDVVATISPLSSNGNSTSALLYPVIRCGAFSSP